MSLWSFFQSDQIAQSPQYSMRFILSPIQRASFCTWNKASYTLEAAIVIPFLAGYLVTLLFFFRILDVQCVVEEALHYAGRKTAVESCMTESEEILFISAEAYLLYALKDSERIDRYVENGVLGISLLGSKIGQEYILLRADYVVELPIQFFGIGQMKFNTQHAFRKWTGDRRLEEDQAYVYITATGEVYHANLSCRVIHLSVKEATLDRIPFLRGKAGQRYYECGRCEWQDKKKERVYYTDYGEFYHKDIACSAIKRTVEKISLEDIGERRPCSFCYGL